MYFYKRSHPLCIFYKYIFSKPVERRRRKALEPVPDGWLSAAHFRDAIRGGWRFLVIYTDLILSLKSTLYQIKGEPL